MFDLKLASESELLAPDFFRETTAVVRAWLAANPSFDGILKQLPALELALAAHVKNHDSELLALTLVALERVNTNASFDSLSNTNLAALIFLNLRAFQLTHDARFQTAVQRVIALAKTRWDEENAFFKTSAMDTTNVFDTDANAQLGQAFYFAWRALDDQTLRPIAGEVLGHMSRVYDPQADLDEMEELPSRADDSSNTLATRAAAMQFFLTASETTGRRTYMTRACILADDALKNFDLAGTFDERAKFADALLRLEQFTSITRYRDTARELLKNAVAVIEPNVDTASLALSIEHANHFPLHVVVIGDVENDAHAQALWFTAMNEYASTRAIEVLHPTQHATRIQALGYLASDKNAARIAQAYICIGTLCLPPVSSLDAFREAMRQVRKI